MAMKARAADDAWPHPNVVLVITDDQGYGELACHGNPIIRTPHLDALHAQSVRFTAFHVSPTCAPTRASLMTGRHEFRNGVTHTIHERERLGLKGTTLAQMLKQAGYTTGIFGKWHLGDQEPYQPQNRGFDEVFIHGAGGIGQSYPGSCGDAPGNKYFDPAIRHNGSFVKTQGYCTDIFFTQALRWIKQSKDRPFFAYITTNAPHGPLVCPQSYSKPYVDAGLDPAAAAFYGMITNIDNNVGLLLEKLDAWGLAEKTLVIFMTDNGSAQAGPRGGRRRRKGKAAPEPAPKVKALYNAGMRGKKGSPYEGGTRVPGFFRWKGRTPEGVDVGALAAHVDIFPTLAELCGGKLPAGVKLDGRSLVPLLRDPKAEWPDRTLFTHVGRWGKGQAAQSKFRACSVRSQRYRLVNNRELYDITNDPGEKTNVIAKHPDVVAAMRKAYDQWWAEVLPAMVNEDAPVPKENPFRALYRKQAASGKGIPKWPAEPTAKQL
ncbi:MAG: arylsulfatase [Candidatus Brocadiae bacterium]|nr:arylsulfatase [Candidatus Brocadiia bacterium]